MSETLNRREFLKGAGAVIGGGFLGFTVNRLLSDDDRKLQELRDELKEIQEENIVGDCMNENMLRNLYGAPPATLNECIEERREWNNERKRGNSTSG